MKLNENFSAGATKKVNPLEAAINSNFTNQQAARNPLPDARESILAGEQAAAGHISSPRQNSAVTSAAQSQILNAAQSSPAVQPTQAQAENPSSAEPKTQSRREVKEKFLVSMSKGERSIFKAFCAMQNVSMNHFVMCAMDYFKEDLENGKVSLSSHSYKRKES